MNEVQTQGIVLKREQSGSPSVYTAVGNLLSFDGPGGKAAEIDITNLSSAAKEFLLGLPDEGTFNLELNLNPSDAQQTGMRTDRASRTLRGFQLCLNDTAGTIFNFQGYVMEFKISGTTDNVVKAHVSIRITGPVVVTP